MWYKIWTTVVEQIPLIVVLTILMSIACLYVGAQKKYTCPRCEHGSNWPKGSFTITVN